MLGNIIINTNGIYFSSIILISIILFFLLSKRFYPSFYIPNKHKNILKDITKKTITYILTISLILLPLNISLIKDKQTIKEKTTNIQILFDVSLSMTANDIKPSRFESAKQSVINLTKSLTGYNVSVIIFSGIPFIWMPFTDNTSAIVSKLNNMNLSQFPPTINFVGTSIGDSIMLGSQNLVNISKKNNNPGLIILITDGDSNKGSNPIESSTFAKSLNIPIYTLGIGNSNFIVGNDRLGNPVTTDINIDLLKNISQISGGKFYRVLTDKEFSEIFGEISNLVKSQEITNIKYNYFYINEILYRIIILLIILLFIIRLNIGINIIKNNPL